MIETWQQVLGMRGYMSNSDWTGNSMAGFLGNSSHTEQERQEVDYYATDPRCVDDLMSIWKPDCNVVWEPAAGGGHISKALERHGYRVASTDLYDHGYAPSYAPYDFLTSECIPAVNDGTVAEQAGAIITNPPYKYALEFAEKMASLNMPYAMFLKLTFLETAKRRKFFEENPPRYVAVYSKRVNCAKNGNEDEFGSGAICYAWFIWEPGFIGNPEILWI